jgi:hypothetical protein
MDMTPQMIDETIRGMTTMRRAFMNSLPRSSQTHSRVWTEGRVCSWLVLIRAAIRIARARDMNICQWSLIFMRIHTGLRVFKVPQFGSLLAQDACRVGYNSTASTHAQSLGKTFSRLSALIGLFVT